MYLSKGPLFRKCLLRTLLGVTNDLDVSSLEFAILRSSDYQGTGKHVANVSSVEVLLKISVPPILEFCLVLNVLFWDSVEEDSEQFALILFRHWSKMDGQVDSGFDSNIDRLGA
jgi:hypothetical protein